MKLKLKVWRQKNNKEKGGFVTYDVVANEHMSFLEMMDVLNESLIADKKEPVAFEHDCREGICGACGMVINGRPHGPNSGTTTCQLHMRYFKDGETIVVEPWRSRAFPVIKDLVVNRNRHLIILFKQAAFVSVNTGQAPDGNSVPIEKDVAGTAMDAATCIGCGACVAACPNGSAMLFTSAKVSHLSAFTTRKSRISKKGAEYGGDDGQRRVLVCVRILKHVKRIVRKRFLMDHIAKMNREYMGAVFGGK